MLLTFCATNHFSPERLRKFGRKLPNILMPLVIELVPNHVDAAGHMGDLKWA